MDQATRQNLMTAFNNVLRTSALVGKIDHQRTSLAFAALLQNLPDGSVVVPLQPIFDFLIEQKAPEAAIHETLAYLHSRGGRFGVSFALPASLQKLSEEEHSRLVLAMAARGPVGAGASSSTAPPSPSPSRSAAPSPPTPASPAPTADPRSAKKRKKQSTPEEKTRRLLGILALSAVGLVGSILWNNVNKADVPGQITIEDPQSLPCVTLLDASHAFMCYVHDDFLNATPEPAIKMRAEALRRVAVARGKPSRPVQIISHERRIAAFQF